MSKQTKYLKAEKMRNAPAVKLCAATMLLTALALVIGGCSFAPKYKTPSVPIADAYKETNGWKMAQPQDDAIRGKWWEVFGDPQLNAYEDQVTISNQNLAAAFANVLEARAVAREARAQYYPTVSANPSVVRSRSSANTSLNSSSSSNRPGNVTGNLYTLPLNASWEPDLWGTIRNTVKADVYNAQASLATLAN